MGLLTTVTLLRTLILTLTRMDTMRRITAMVIRRSGSDSVTAADTMADAITAADTEVQWAASTVVEQSAAAAVDSAAAVAAMVAVVVNVRRAVGSRLGDQSF